MWQFLQTYGIWILFIAFLVLMMRMHGSDMHGQRVGGCCGMGMNQGESDQHDQLAKRQQVGEFRDGRAHAKLVVPLDGYTDEQQAILPGAEYSDAERKVLVRGE